MSLARLPGPRYGLLPRHDSQETSCSYRGSSIMQQPEHTLHSQHTHEDLHEPVASSLAVQVCYTKRHATLMTSLLPSGPSAARLAHYRRRETTKATSQREIKRDLSLLRLVWFLPRAVHCPVTASHASCGEFKAFFDCGPLGKKSHKKNQPDDKGREADAHRQTSSRHYMSNIPLV